MYFVEKCVNIEEIYMNNNLIYDLNFNSINQLDNVNRLNK